MAIRRLVIITCDGPCGTTLQATKVPVDWSKLTISKYEKLEQGQKPSFKRIGVFCPSCLEALLNLFKGRFTLSTGSEEGQNE